MLKSSMVKWALAAILIVPAVPLFGKTHSSIKHSPKSSTTRPSKKLTHVTSHHTQTLSHSSSSSKLHRSLSAINHANYSLGTHQSKAKSVTSKNTKHKSLSTTKAKHHVLAAAVKSKSKSLTHQTTPHKLLSHKTTSHSSLSHRSTAPKTIEMPSGYVPPMIDGTHM